MAGHIQDRWMRVKRDPETGKPVHDKNGKAVKERNPDLWGKGDRYKVRYPKPGGGEDSKTFPDKQLKKAQAFLTKMQHDILEGTYVDPHAGKIELRTYTENYLKGRSQDLSSQETIRSVVAASIYPFLGDKTLDAINVDTLRNFLAWMNDKGISANYQTQVWNTLSSILDAAKEEKKISVNHCESKAISKPRRIETKIIPWTEAKLNKVALALGPRYKITVPIGAGLGLRQGEIFAFTVDDIDREKMIYRCRRQIATLNKEQTFRLPKGHKTREIPLSQGVLDEIDAYAENFPPVTVTLPWSERDGKKTETVRLLIVDEDGNALRRSSFNDNVWHPAFKRGRTRARTVAGRDARVATPLRLTPAGAGREHPGVGRVPRSRDGRFHAEQVCPPDAVQSRAREACRELDVQAAQASSIHKGHHGDRGDRARLRRLTASDA